MDYTKHLRGTVALVAVLSVTACAIPTANTVRISQQEAESFRIDCNHKQEQLEFLRAQLIRPYPYNNVVTTNGEPVLNPVIQKDITGSIIQARIQSLNTWCPR
jgi:hypothetical protein